jgi:UrcA family protein
MYRIAHSLTLLATVAMAASATAGAASPFSRVATPANQAPTMTVRFADLNLTTDQGVAALYHRLSYAARQVCPRADLADLNGQQISHDCQAVAIQQAVRSIGSPMLARVAVDHGVSND